MSNAATMDRTTTLTTEALAQWDAALDEHGKAFEKLMEAEVAAGCSEADWDDVLVEHGGESPQLAAIEAAQEDLASVLMAGADEALAAAEAEIVAKIRGILVSLQSEVGVDVKAETADPAMLVKWARRIARGERP